MRALIVGGSGFVGRNLTNFLYEQGHEVAVIDRKIRETTSPVSYFEGDANDIVFLQKVIGDFRPDSLYHLAANSDIQSGATNSSLDFNDTLMTTVSLRQAVIGSSVKQLVFASSSAIYGHSTQAISEAQSENFIPVSWYGKAKLASEYVLESIHAEESNMKILFVRFPNVVGPFATHGVIFDFINKLRKDPQHLEVLGDGKQSKPYIHVSELIDGIEFFRTNQEHSFEHINIGPTDTATVRFIADAVTESLGLEPDISFGRTPYGWVGDVPNYSFDTSKMNDRGFFVKLSSKEAILKACNELVLEF
jgi:UDP-glucose 4-epimerase